MKHEALTSKIIAICMKVHSALGPGLLESIYEEAVCIELTQEGIPYERQKVIRAIYDGKDMGRSGRADLIVDKDVLVELKSVTRTAPVHSMIALTYMRFAKIEVGLMINFNVARLKDGIKRLVLDR
jgi:GxxExxY protein